MKKLKKDIVLNIKIEEIEKKKEYMKNDYYKRKHLLNHLINCVEELENISLNKKLENKRIKRFAFFKIYRESNHLFFKYCKFFFKMYDGKASILKFLKILKFSQSI